MRLRGSLLDLHDVKCFLLSNRYKGIGILNLSCFFTRHMRIDIYDIEGSERMPIYQMRSHVFP